MYRLTLLFAICGLLLQSCGSAPSLAAENTYVDFASVTVKQDLIVSGRLLQLDDERIVISVDGAIVEYAIADIVSYHRFQAPDPILMQQDLVKNSRIIADNTGFMVFITMLTIVASLISVAGLL